MYSVVNQEMQRWPTWCVFLSIFLLKQTSLVQSIQFTVYAYDDANGPQAKVGQHWIRANKTKKQISGHSPY